MPSRNLTYAGRKAEFGRPVLNPTHFLTRGLKRLWYLSDPLALSRDLATGMPGKENGKPSWSTGGFGEPNFSFEHGRKFDSTGTYILDALTPVQGGQAVSLETWCYPTVGGFKTPAALFGSSSDKGYWFDVSNDGSAVHTKWEFIVSLDGSSQGGPISASTESLNALYHLVGTFDGTTATLYVNGASRATSPQSGTIHTVTTSNAFAIGRLGALSSDYFGGTIFKVAVYNRVLSAAEVALLYRQPFAQLAWMASPDIFASVSGGAATFLPQWASGANQVLGWQPC